MGPNRKPKKVFHLLAKAVNLIFLAFLLFFLLSHLFGHDESGEGFSSTKELITFLLFPIGVILGYLISIKWEIFGAMVSISSVLLLFSLRSDLLESPHFYLFLLPGILLLLSNFFSRKKPIQ